MDQLSSFFSAAANRRPYDVTVVKEDRPMQTPDLEAQDFVHETLMDAARQGASDLYWIPSGSGVDLRRRVDGIQHNVGRLPRDYGERCVTRVKVLAGLLTYKTKVSQDGALHLDVEGSRCDMRVSVMPSLHGERVSIRLLQAGDIPQHIENLNLSEAVAADLREMLRPESGLIILTGPTGSGKTTTIYAMIRELLKMHQDPASIITIEDPVECEIPGVTQSAVSAEGDWGYADALRAALRQDVKTLVVGEMRDREVVQVTLDAALTGHRVITTYHAGDIPSVYARMLHQGFEPFLVAAAITGVVTQRLAPAAGGTGRVPVVATLPPDDAWREFVATGPGLGELRAALRDRPTASLSAAAAKLKASHIITHSLEP